MESDSQEFVSSFKKAQVRYRRQGTNPNRIDDLNELIDFSFPESDSRIILKHNNNNNNNNSHSLPPPPPPGSYHGTLYGLDGFSGFLYAPQALSSDLQLEIAYRSVSEFCETPHTTNIDLIPPKANEKVNSLDETMWNIWKKQQQQQQQCSKVTKTDNKKAYRSFQKLSWATSGYQYDWTARAYHEGSKSPMPPFLEELSTKFATTALWLEHKTVLPKTFTASACIVNYYSVKSIMGGHCDDLELAVDKPVISLSVGLPGIFLLGGKTKDDTTTPVLPILVRPGDVYILGGDCRMNYHGMARVIPDTAVRSIPHPPQIPGEALQVGKSSDDNVPDDDDKEHLQAFLRQYRININVRQVLPDGVTQIPDPNIHASEGS